MNYLDEYDPSTFAFIQRVPVATQGFVSGLAGDGLGGAPPDEWYSVNVQAGASLALQSSTPSDQGGQFPNTASLEIELYDTYGNLVAVGTKDADGRNESLFFNAPVTGTYYIHVTPDPGGYGEYFLQVLTQSYPAGSATGEVYNDLNGSGTLQPGDPGLSGWEVDLYDANNNFIASQITDTNGDFDFSGLAPGTYTAVEVVQDGWTQTAPPSPGTFTFTVTAGGTVTGLDFGNFQDVTISGEVFNDLTGSGSFAPGDPGLQGWTVDLLDVNGNIVATTITDANGDYSFTDVGPGTYTVQEELQPGWIQTAPPLPGTYTVTATSGQDATGLLFGNFELVTFSGIVFDDLAGSGVYSPSDPGLQGWTVDLLDSNGNLIATTTSAADGSFSFANVGPGTYTVEEDNAARMAPDRAAAAGHLRGPGDQQHQPLGAGLRQLPARGRHGRGLQRPQRQRQPRPGRSGPGGLDGQPAQHRRQRSGHHHQRRQRQLRVRWPVPGTFIVEEVLMSGWVRPAGNPNYYEFATQSGMDETGLNFGNALPGITISGSVYNDLNGSGSYVAGDPLLAGWTIDLYDQSGGLVASTTSDSNGNYSFSNVPSEGLTVVEVVQAGWYLTQPVNPPGTYTIPAGSGDVSGLAFGDFKEYTVSGNVYNDQDGNGLKGPSEPGLAGWTVDLTDSSGNVLASVLTDSNGNYSFTGVGPGTFGVAEVIQTNWVQTQPQYPTTYSFTGTSGHNISAVASAITPPRR